ncbi:SecDF P1 head subdomain-containing protein [Cellulomonas xylanilytica]|uniref:SecDF P1 head subdomain domain-containing protein n=1 Tax=Cellulomonas xylanilytica TaxID=233583 RepID=A0A510V0U9_9CELL|nr:hypothetical protein [Cellulomonas xylanilytica]GEK20534.1 hypothetical protein CXY01_10540 [Cellulomonas xylanilytica]
MHAARSFAHLAVLVSVAAVAAGCAADDAGEGPGGATAPPLELRLVTSSDTGPCSAPPLTTDGPGSACDIGGATTYELGETLGVVTPTSVTREGQAGEAVAVEFDEADTKTLEDVSGQAIGGQLALLLDGKVLSAPTVHAAITTSPITFGFGSAADADRVAALLGTSATP